MNRQNLLRKIRGLLNKAADSGVSLEESYTFMAKAQELIIKYKIDKRDLNISQDEIDFEIFDTYVKVFKGSAPNVESLNYYINTEFLAELSWLISNKNFCRSLRAVDYKHIEGVPYKYKALKIIGKPEDIEICLETFRFAYKKYIKLSISRYRQAKFKRQKMGDKELKVLTDYQYVDKLTFIRSYLKGILKGLENKYNSYYLENNNDDNYHIMIFNYKEAIDAYIEREIGEIVDAKERKSKLDAEAFKQGKEDAKTNDSKQLDYDPTKE